MTKIKVIIGRPGKQLEVKEIQNGFETFKSIVGGEVEFIPSANYLVIICRQSERISDEAAGVAINNVLVGTIIFTKLDEARKEFISLNDEDIQFIMEREN